MTVTSSTRAHEQVIVLGATGSIGRSALDLIKHNPQHYSVFGLSADKNVELMKTLIEQHKPKQVAMSNKNACTQLEQWSRSANINVQILSGEEGLCALAAEDGARIVIAGIVGMAGLAPILAAARSGKRILLANKEALVCAGSLLIAAVAEHGAELLPVDSEHNGIFQCVHGDLSARGTRRLILTASGGPFRELPAKDFASVTPKQACAHPVWSMGRKISVDSATLMNKGLEMIEAAYLFGKSVDEIDTVIHPQSIVHALVEFNDGNILAQLSRPDMRGALAVGLAWPERISSGVAPLDIAALGKLEFSAPDYVRFPCLGLAREALSSGHDAPIFLNIANEVAVNAFLAEAIGFNAIAQVVETTLLLSEGCAVNTLDDLSQVNERAHAIAHEAVRKISGEKITLAYT